MELKLGAHIAALRKSEGITQEQLAAAVGVSAPAVSKWETDASCPDIALLCPLARALNTNVDTLLRFEETLTEEQVVERCNRIVESARNEGVEPAERMLEELLHNYPSSVLIKYYAAAALNLFLMLSPVASEEKKNSWGKQKKELLEQVHGSGVSAYWQSAVIQLASIAIADNELDRAEELLKELPEHSGDPTLIWSQLYLKRGEASKASEVIQKRLFLLLRQVQSCLIQMMNEELEPDVDQRLKICEVYRNVEELFGFGGGLSEGFFVEFYQKAGRKEEALESIHRFVDAVTGPLQEPNPLLFSSVTKSVNKGEGDMKVEHPALTRELKELLLREMQSNDHYADLREEPMFQSAVEKLRQSIELD